MEAVENYNGATLIIAGAGSGKTRTLTCRIANMIEKGVRPWNIMALTFTNKAAREMRERIKKTVPAENLRGIYMGTFHGIFRRLLAENAERLGFPNEYTIYDSADSQNLIKQIVRELELPDEYYKPRLIASRISLAKNNLMLPEVYASRDVLLEEDRQMRVPKLFQIYDLYFKKCKAAGAMDFDDILLYMNILLRDNPEITEKYGKQFQYILVDEYQDTNSAQYLIIKRLASSHGNICVVGDDSQSIYSFRGAKIENILRFQKDYADARVVKLEQNYRSTANIVEAANSLIEHNTRKLPKHLFSNKGEGDKLKVIGCFNDRNEAEEVTRSIQNALYAGSTPDNFAILYRTNAQSRVFEDALRHRNIPYRIYGGQSFYQRAEVKDMLAYIKLAVNPRDDQALLRVINTPARGIGDTSVRKVADMAAQMNISIMEILSQKSPADMGIRGTAVKGLENFVAIFRDAAVALQNKDAYEFASEMAERSGILQHLRLSKLVEDVSRLDNVGELLGSIKEYVENFDPSNIPAAPADPTADLFSQSEAETEEPTPTIGGWLAEVSLLTDQDQEQDDTPRVTMLTVHASKGLEFKDTYIVGLEENLFPSNRAGSEDEIEEERRIFYVALTRAERCVTLSFAQSRFRYGETVDCIPSRFIAEIDVKYLDGDVDMAVSGGMRAFVTTDDDKPATTAKKSASGGRPAWGANRRPASGTGATPAGRTPTPAPTGTIGQKLTRVAPPSPAAAPDTRPLANVGDIVVGARVEHARFGLGEVISLETVGNDVRITVNFNSGGSKTLLQKFAKLKMA